MDEWYADERDERDGPREHTPIERFFWVMGLIVAVGVAVTFRFTYLGSLELWMVIPGAIAAFVTAIALWWTNAFRYRP